MLVVGSFLVVSAAWLADASLTGRRYLRVASFSATGFSCAFAVGMLSAPFVPFLSKLS